MTCTCALSEPVEPRPSGQVADWFDAASPDALFVSVLTPGGIRKGIERLGDGRRRARIVAWLESELPAWFEDRVLPIDTGIADEWGCLMARARNIPAVDGLIAATALRRRLTIVARNEADFAATGVDLLNPWTD